MKLKIGAASISPEEQKFFLADIDNRKRKREELAIRREILELNNMEVDIMCKRQRCIDESREKNLQFFDNIRAYLSDFKDDAYLKATLKDFAINTFLNTRSLTNSEPPGRTGTHRLCVLPGHHVHVA